MKVTIRVWALFDKPPSGGSGRQRQFEYERVIDLDALPPSGTIMFFESGGRESNDLSGTLESISWWENNPAAPYELTLKQLDAADDNLSEFDAWMLNHGFSRTQ